jgi:hypothetical protein
MRVFVIYVATEYGIEVTLEALPEIAYDRIQIYGSIDNDRVNAVRVETGKGHWFRIPYQQIQTKWLWAYTVKGARRSEWSSDVNDGFQATGGAPYREIDHFVETFDSYSSREDFEREWAILSGDPTITFGTTGINGSKVMRVTGAMRAMYKRFVAYDYTQIYECATRFRSAGHEAGNEALSVGFFGATATVTIDAAGNPTVSGSIPNRVVCAGIDLATYDNWQRAITWITGSETFNLSSPTALHLPFDLFNSPWRPQHIRALNDGTKAQYIRPTIECNQPNGGNAACELDFIEVRKLATTDVGLSEIADGNMSAADDNEYWAAPLFDWDAVLVLDQGLNGGNELKFAVSGTVTNNLIAAYNRNALKIADTLTVSVHYRLVSVSSIGSVVDFGAGLEGLVLSGEMPRHFEQVGGTIPTQTVNVNTLEDDGTTQVTTFTFTGLFANAQIVNSDYMMLRLFIQSPEASDEFDLRVRRVRLARGT